MMFVRSFFNRLNLIFFIRFLMAQSERTFIRLYSITYGKSESISITIAQKITHSFLHYRQLRIRSFFNHPKPFFFRFFSSWFHYTVPIKRAFTPYFSELKNAWIFYICDIIVANDRDTMKWNEKNWTNKTRNNPTNENHEQNSVMMKHTIWKCIPMLKRIIIGRIVK